MSKANKPSGSNNEVKTTEATGRSPNSTPSTNQTNQTNNQSKKATPREFSDTNARWCSYCSSGTHYSRDCFRDPKSAKYRPPEGRLQGSVGLNRSNQPNTTNKPNSSATRRLEIRDRTEEGCRTFAIGSPRDVLDGLPPPDALRIEERIVDRIHYPAVSQEIELLGNQTEVSSSQKKKTRRLPSRARNKFFLVWVLVVSKQ